MDGTNATPKAFISYSWDDDDHKKRVKELATRLRGDGVDVTLDQWAAVPGDQLPAFMEKAIRENDFVLIVCTPKYREKSDSRKGGVGYEGDIMTGEIFAKSNHRKFIPILHRGDWDRSSPSWLRGKYRIDLNGDPYNEDQYNDLLTTLHNIREQAPPIGPRPSLRAASKQEGIARYDAQGWYVEPKATVESEAEPIKILGVIADEVGTPPNDGTPGCALYAVPIKLSRFPSHEWTKLFVEAWNHPPSGWTNMHRPGIATVHRDRVILNRTTMEEVRDIHRKTLTSAVDTANKQFKELIAQQRAAEEARIAQEQQRKINIQRIAGEIDFDKT